MTTPKVSIIIPAYNEQKNILRLLKSIRRQTYSSIESIVVDDGSNDNTVKISKKLATKVFARSHAERSVQRNFGASRATGSFFLFLDADMELSPGVVKSCVDNINNYGALIIPEMTVGKGLVAKIRKFERSMYMGDALIEVARFFPKKIFDEFEGYDVNLTGAEDYDLPKRVSKKYKIGWAKEYLYHHEAGLTLMRQMKKKFYYAKNSALYAQKHPDLISKQGILILRKAYIRNWRKFLTNPLLGLALIGMRALETISAALGFLIAVGPLDFVKTFLNMFRYLK